MSSSISSSATARARRRKPRTSTTVMMALHFPKPPKMPKPPPPPPPSDDKNPAGGKSPGREASPTSVPGGAARTNSSSAVKGDASSPKAKAKGANGGAGSEGVVDVSGLVTKTKSVAVGHANATRTDLNGGKVSNGYTG